MDHVKTFRKIYGVDAGYHESVIHPANGEGCVGARGIDKTYTRDQVFELASRMDPKPNIIIRAGPNAKWYFKILPIQSLVTEIQKQRWRDTSRCTMYVIEWD
jgi:hypothetical protein